jgi:hypothetical protein
LPQRIHGATGISSDISAAIKKEKQRKQSDFNTKDTKTTKGRQETKGWKKEGALRTSMAFPIT